VSPYADKPVIGSGPYHSPAPAAASYPSAVYLCAGDDFHWPSGNAYCYRSDDGGHTWGQAKVASPGTGPCLPFAGEVAVDGDGIVYLPLEHCGSRQGLASSSDNGETWRVTTVPGVRDAAQNFDEFPDVASDSDGRLYYAATGRGRPVVAVSDDQGRHWRPAVDVGAEAGIRYAQFPTLVAGDGGRAAFAFLGSTTPGYPENSNYTGAWHLYVAVTVDGGASWDASCRGQDTPALDDRQQRGVVARWLVLRLRLRACPRHRTRHRGDCAKDLRP